MGLWLAVPLYWVLVWAACRRKKVYSLPFRFLEGCFLAYTCFAFLPPAFEGNVFFAGGGAFIGIGIGVFAEGLLRKKEKNIQWLTAVAFALLLLPWGNGLRGFMGGLGLYAAGVGILPEENGLNKQIMAAVGGGIGFLLGVLLFF